MAWGWRFVQLLENYGPTQKASEQDPKPTECSKIGSLLVKR